MPVIQVEVSEEQAARYQRGLSICIDPPRPRHYVITSDAGNAWGVTTTETLVPFVGGRRYMQLRGECVLLLKGDNPNKVGHIQDALHVVAVAVVAVAVAPRPVKGAA